MDNQFPQKRKVPTYLTNTLRVLIVLLVFPGAFLQIISMGSANFLFLPMAAVALISGIIILLICFFFIIKPLGERSALHSLYALLITILILFVYDTSYYWLSAINNFYTDTIQTARTYEYAGHLYSAKLDNASKIIKPYQFDGKIFMKADDSYALDDADAYFYRSEYANGMFTGTDFAEPYAVKYKDEIIKETANNYINSTKRAVLTLQWKGKYTDNDGYWLIHRIRPEYEYEGSGCMGNKILTGKFIKTSRNTVSFTDIKTGKDYSFYGDVTEQGKFIDTRDNDIWSQIPQYIDTGQEITIRLRCVYSFVPGGIKWIYDK